MSYLTEAFNLKLHQTIPITLNNPILDISCVIFPLVYFGMVIFDRNSEAVKAATNKSRYKYYDNYLRDMSTMRNYCVK